jgi:hypothetical protein
LRLASISTAAVGKPRPEALRVEALAIKAALDEAQRAQDEFDKLHGPMTFGKTAGISLGAIPDREERRRLGDGERRACSAAARSATT